MGTDEWVDLVDADDVPLGRVARSAMRRDNLRHRCVWILVFDPHGALFVHQRTATKDLYPSFWDVAVGGVVGAGESYDASARRELAEEVGVVDVPVWEIAALQFADEHTNVVGRVYACSSSGALTLQESEVAGGEWIAAVDMVTVFATRRFCPDGLAAFNAAVRSSTEGVDGVLAEHLSAFAVALSPMRMAAGCAEGNGP